MSLIDAMKVLGAVTVVGLVALAALKYLRQIAIAIQIKRGAYHFAADLDAVKKTPFVIQIDGVYHVIKPMNLQRYADLSAAMMMMDELRKQKLTEDKLLDAYAMAFNIASPTITREMVSKMTHHQVGVTFQTVCDFLAGKAQMEAEKKRPKSGGPLRNVLGMHRRIKTTTP